jgi:SAM-dependent methyltransferase
MHDGTDTRAAFWNQVAVDLGKRSDGELLASYLTPFTLRRRATVLPKFLQGIPVEGRSCLEVGCGPGGNLRILATRKPARLAGVDIAPNMVELARKNLADLPVELSLLSDGRLNYPDASFDISFTCTVLEHNDDAGMSALVAEICRVTRDSVYILEDTRLRRRRGKYLFHARPMSAYVDEFKRFGFDYVRHEHHRDNLARAACTAIRRTLTPRDASYASPRSRLSERLERAAIAVLTPLDRVLPLPFGITTMAFASRRPATFPTGQ